MFFLDFVIGLIVLLAVLSMGLVLLKIIFNLVLLPFKLLIFLTKGLLAIVVGLPLLLLFGAVLTVALPLGLVFLALPLCLVGGLVYAFVS